MDCSLLNVLSIDLLSGVTAETFPENNRKKSFQSFSGRMCWPTLDKGSRPIDWERRRKLKISFSKDSNNGQRLETDHIGENLSSNSSATRGRFRQQLRLSEGNSGEGWKILMGKQ